MTPRRVVVALVSLLGLLAVCIRAPALDVVRRATGSLEVIAMRRHERPMSLEKPSEPARVRVTRFARTPEADPARDPSFSAALAANGLLHVAASSPSDSLAPHATSWIEPAPTHADLMVFLN